MIGEPLLYFGIGVVLTALFIFSIRPIIRSRFGQRTMQRLDAAAPALMAEIEADMGQIHSQIAVATRRLEMSVEQMKLKTTGQLSEIGRSSETIGRLRAEIAERSSAFSVLQEREAAAATQLISVEAELAARSTVLHELEKTIIDRKAELAKFMAEFNVHPELAKVQSLHMAEVDGLKTEKAVADQMLKESREECLKLQYDIELIAKQVETTWASERMANAVLRERINDVASEVVRVAVALEGLGSPMDSLLASKTANGGGQAAAETGEEAHSPPTAILDAVEDSTASLVHRVRALRRRSAQLPAAE